MGLYEKEDHGRIYIVFCGCANQGLASGVQLSRVTDGATGKRSAGLHFCLRGGNLSGPTALPASAGVALAIYSVL